MDSEVEVMEEALEEAMFHLVQIMRHLLANLHEEQFAQSQNNYAHVNIVLMKRQHILEELSQRQQKMAAIIQSISRTPITLENLGSVIGEDKVSILTLRDQILALADSIEKDSHPISHQQMQQIPLPKTAPKKQTLTLIDPDTQEDI